MKTLIIGGAGYVGSYLRANLSKYCTDISSVDIEWFGSPKYSNNIAIDFKAPTDVFYKKFDVIILLAGHSSVKMSGDVNSTLNNNVRNFYNLLSKLKDSKTKLIYASSSSVYVNTFGKEVAEDFYSPCVHPYDLSKRQIDQICELSDIKIEYYGLRFGTVNGNSPHTRSDIMINAMTKNAKEKGTIQLFNGHQNRPILGINDLYRAIKSIMQKGKYENRGIYNLASFNSTSENIALEVGRVLNCPVDVIKTPTGSSIYDFKISTDKFKSTFDFEFEDTVSSIVESFDEEPLFSSDRNKVIEYE